MSSVFAEMRYCDMREERNSARKLPIDTLRGLACLLLVLYHSVGILGPVETLPPTSHAFVYLSLSVMFVRMPLFTFLSGAVYAGRPFTRARWSTFLIGKARRLLVPFVVVGSLYAGLSAVRDGDWTGLLPHVVLGQLVWYFDPLWFLQALLLCFVLIVTLEWCGWLETPKQLAAVFGVAATTFVITEYHSNVLFAANRMIYLFPFFLLGLWCIRFPEFLTRRSVRFALWAGAIGCLSLVQLVLLGIVELPLDKMGWLGLATGVSTCAALLASRWQWLPLALLGQFSFAVYLYHRFGIKLADWALDLTGTSGSTVVLVGACVGGIALPVAVDLIARRFDLGRVLLLGLRPRRPLRLTRYLPGKTTAARSESR